MRPGRHLIFLGATIAVAALFGTVGCSVSTNDEPQEAGELFTQFVQTTTSTTSSTTTPEDVTRAADVYFLQAADASSVVKAVSRNFEVGAPVEEILRNLFTVPPDTTGEEKPDERGLTTAIPESAVLTSAALVAPDSSQLVIDTTLFDTVDGSRLRNALAQIVLTATSSPSVESVSFVNEGDTESPIVASGETVSRPVTEDDYRSLR